MKEDIKQEWVTALESGEYSQTKGVLHDSKGFCCLGVLTDIYAKKTGDEWIPAGRDQVCFKMKNLKYPSVAVLPYDIRGWSDMGNSVGMTDITDRDGNAVALTELNDAGLTFPQIADVIKAFL